MSRKPRGTTHKPFWLVHHLFPSCPKESKESWYVAKRSGDVRSQIEFEIFAHLSIEREEAEFSYIIV